MRKKYYIFAIKDNYENNETVYTLIGPFSQELNYSYFFSVNGYETKEEAEKALENNQGSAFHFITEKYDW